MELQASEPPCALPEEECARGGGDKACEAGGERAGEVVAERHGRHQPGEARDEEQGAAEGRLPRPAREVGGLPDRRAEGGEAFVLQGFEGKVGHVQSPRRRTCTLDAGVALHHPPRRARDDRPDHPHAAELARVDRPGIGREHRHIRVHPLRDPTAPPLRPLCKRRQLRPVI